MIQTVILAALQWAMSAMGPLGPILAPVIMTLLQGELLDAYSIIKTYVAKAEAGAAGANATGTQKFVWVFENAGEQIWRDQPKIAGSAIGTLINMEVQRIRL